ncbi:MAG: hypothetical protein Kow0027_28410 [Saprospiraceae bacterium]
MSARISFLSILFLFGFSSQTALHAQLWTMRNKPASNPNPVMWELGLHTGSAVLLADIDPQPGLASGFHLRKSLDYLFSLRAEARYLRFRNSDQQDGTTRTNFFSGELQLLVTLNNFNWSSKGPRRFNLYTWLGGGVNHYAVKVKEKISADLRPVSSSQTHAGTGMGLAWKINDRFNMGLEAGAMILFGNNADRLDGISRRGNDVAAFSSLRLNYNIGDARRRSQPLYWASPIDAILEQVTEVKTPAPVNFSDQDHDGVLDELDLDPHTPPDVPVDTRGRPLDSDGDGLPDYEDPDPYIPFYDKNKTLTEEEIRQIVQDELNKTKPETDIDPEAINAFLPLIHFDEDSDNIRYADHTHLATVARLMKRYPNIRLVVKGFTDRTASRTYNLDLSYRRAKAVIDYLVHVHGIERHRLILQYSGEDDPLVPSRSSEIINRRVEFRIATSGDREMERN